MSPKDLARKHAIITSMRSADVLEDYISPLGVYLVSCSHPIANFTVKADKELLLDALYYSHVIDEVDENDMPVVSGRTIDYMDAFKMGIKNAQFLMMLFAARRPENKAKIILNEVFK